MDIIQILTTPESLVTILVALAAFATVLTIAAPYMTNDKLATRMKEVSTEREKLRAAQKAALEAGANRLREKKQTGAAASIVERLNLRKVFQAETTREKLRNAGLRSDRHLNLFLAARAIVPIILSVFAFVYTSTVFYERFPSVNIRLGISLVLLVVGSYFPNLLLSNMITKRQKSIKRAWSDALDLLLICIESGMALEPSMQRVAKEISSQSLPLSEELHLTTAELAYLPERRKALENLAKRTGLETVKSVVTALIQAERYGTPLGSSLRVLAEENRRDRMALAEKKAAALSPKLTVPMIGFFLPCIFVVILGPAVMLAFKAGA